MGIIKALVVDDSAYNRMEISRMLSGAGVDVVGTAHDGVDAITRTLRLQPDVITLDLEMPNMDGFTFLRWLMKERPTPVIVLSSRSDSRSVFRALELGAVDFIAKPEARISKSIEDVREELIEKVQGVMNLEMARVKETIGLLASEKPAIARKENDIRAETGPVEIVAIASSTGGPPAVQAILCSLPPNFGAAIVVAQHMPSGFTRSFAERLNRVSPLPVSEAASGDRISAGAVMIAPGGFHLTVKRNNAGGLFCELVRPKPSDKYVPSADRMMASAAAACGPATLGVVLTGMGKDGAEGVRAIRQQQGRCLAESEESAVIFGMPQEAIRTGAVEKVLPLSRMAGEIICRCSAAGIVPPGSV